MLRISEAGTTEQLAAWLRGGKRGYWEKKKGKKKVSRGNRDFSA